jgi:hypothetical protein
MTFLSNLFHKGGPFFIVNTFFLAIVVGLIVERAIYFLGRGHLNAKQFLENIRKLVSANNVDRAKKLCDATSAPVARVAKAGLNRIHRGEAAVAQQRGQHKVPAHKGVVIALEDEARRGRARRGRAQLIVHLAREARVGNVSGRKGEVAVRGVLRGELRGARGIARARRREHVVVAQREACRVNERQAARALRCTPRRALRRGLRQQHGEHVQRAARGAAQRERRRHRGHGRRRAGALPGQRPR